MDGTRLAESGNLLRAPGLATTTADGTNLVERGNILRTPGMASTTAGVRGDGRSEESGDLFRARLRLHPGREKAEIYSALLVRLSRLDLMEFVRLCRIVRFVLKMMVLRNV